MAIITTTDQLRAIYKALLAGLKGSPGKTKEAQR
ncbi:hypothetical protein BCM14_2975 [Jezberella montanilacus]|jgi:hypothetical protein|uniref:Uncharacterized protein n=1 Tax=Jezberella montanilacus TaxID=323426 RepID=A0A2T0XBP4_9BURK|nr:hypothetical protein BCM14_2975 [Jezberella montanilacus]